VTYWYENGQKEREVNYKDGQLEGPFIQWLENGDNAEGYFKKGEIHFTN